MWPCPAVSFELLGEVCSGTIIGFLCGLLQSTDTPEDVARISPEVRFLSGHVSCLQPPSLSSLTGLGCRPSFNFLVKHKVFSSPIALPPGSISYLLHVGSSFGHLQDSIPQFLAASLLHALATNLCVSRNSRIPPLFEAPGNRCSAVSPLEKRARRPQRAHATNDTPCRPHHHHRDHLVRSLTYVRAIQQNV